MEMKSTIPGLIGVFFVFYDSLHGISAKAYTIHSLRFKLFEVLDHTLFLWFVI